MSVNESNREKWDMLNRDRAVAEATLLSNLRIRQEDLKRLFESSSDHWGYEDPVYRFYHQSYKVYFLQSTTEEIVVALQSLIPNRPLNSWFTEIIAAGTGKVFETIHNENWRAETQPILEAFFHARYFLEMACRYAIEFDSPPTILPSGWASLLYLYDLR